MVRAGITLILFITVFAMMREISATWRSELPGSPVNVEKKAKDVEPLPEVVSLQPNPPVVMPNLKPGYLFNEERLIETEAEKNENELEFDGNDLGIDADIAQLTYSGSIIGDTFSQAIVNFPPGKGAAGPQKSKGRKARSSRSASKEESARLKVGDILSGYQVAEIAPDKIIFKKGDEELEKFLYDPEKKRTAPTRSARAPSSNNPARPAPASANAPNPASSPPSTANRAAAGEESTRPRAPVPSPTSRSQRRMVVSRKPPPRPDTSRVSRRGRSTSPSVATPPMPTLNR